MKRKLNNVIFVLNITESCTATNNNNTKRPFVSFVQKNLTNMRHCIVIYKRNTKIEKFSNVRHVISQLMKSVTFSNMINLTTTSTTNTVTNVSIKQSSQLYSNNIKNRNMTPILKNLIVSTVIIKLIEKIMSNSTKEVSMRM